MRIRQLAYVGLEVTSAAELWSTLLGDVCGTQIVDQADDPDALRFRWDRHDTRLLIHDGESDDLSYLGWQVDGPGDMEDVVRCVEAAGMQVHSASAAELASRRVREMVWFNDPEGLRTEVIYGPLVRSEPLQPGRPHSGFIAGHLGAGHVVVTADDRDGTARFYWETLGFRLSDHGRGRLAFLGCNARHHSIALMPRQMASHERRLEHFMLQVAELDDVGVAWDRCLELGIPLVTTVGKHSNDEAVSFYLRSPAGFEIEYGWGSREVDDATWESGQHAVGLVWGQHRIDELVERLHSAKELW